MPGHFLIRVTNMQSGREIWPLDGPSSTELSTASVDKEFPDYAPADEKLEAVPTCR
jgi:hypothetical protein